jgi:excisionase family DNA binding protein
MQATTSLIELAHKLTLAIDEAAALSGLSKQMIETALKDGRLPHVKEGKTIAINRRDLESFVDSLETITGSKYGSQ